MYRRTGVAPAALHNQPPIWDEAYPYWKAFIALSARRAKGGWGPSTISIESIYNYFVLYGPHDPELQRDYFEILTALDTAWHSLVEKEEKNKSNEKTAETPPDRPVSREIGSGSR